MNVRPMVALVCLIILASLLIFEGDETVASGQQTSEVQTVTAQVYQNTSAIRGMEQRLERVENMELSQNDALASRGERIAHIETIVAEHEWIIRGVLGTLMALLIETGIRIFRKKATS